MSRTNKRITVSFHTTFVKQAFNVFKKHCAQQDITPGLGLRFLMYYSNKHNWMPWPDSGHIMSSRSKAKRAENDRLHKLLIRGYQFGWNPWPDSGRIVLPQSKIKRAKDDKLLVYGYQLDPLTNIGRVQAIAKAVAKKIFPTQQRYSYWISKERLLTEIAILIFFSNKYIKRYMYLPLYHKHNIEHERDKRVFHKESGCLSVVNDILMLNCSRFNILVRCASEMVIPDEWLDNLRSIMIPTVNGHRDDHIEGLVKNMAHNRLEHVLAHYQYMPGSYDILWPKAFKQMEHDKQQWFAKLPDKDQYNVGISPLMNLHGQSIHNLENGEPDDNHDQKAIPHIINYFARDVISSKDYWSQCASTILKIALFAFKINDSVINDCTVARFVKSSYATDDITKPEKSWPINEPRLTMELYMMLSWFRSSSNCDKKFRDFVQDSIAVLKKVNNYRQSNQITSGDKCLYSNYSKWLNKLKILGADFNATWQVAFSLLFYKLRIRNKKMMLRITTKGTPCIDIDWVKVMKTLRKTKHKKFGNRPDLAMHY